MKFYPRTLKEDVTQPIQHLSSGSSKSYYPLVPDTHTLLNHKIQAEILSKYFLNSLPHLQHLKQRKSILSTDSKRSVSVYLHTPDHDTGHPLTY